MKSARTKIKKMLKLVLNMVFQEHPIVVNGRQSAGAQPIEALVAVVDALKPKTRRTYFTRCRSTRGNAERWKVLRV